VKIDSEYLTDSDAGVAWSVALANPGNSLQVFLSLVSSAPPVSALASSRGPRKESLADTSQQYARHCVMLLVSHTGTGPSL